MARLDCDGKPIDAEHAVRSLVTDSIFREFVTNFEVVDTASLMKDKENVTGQAPRKTMRIVSEHTAVISALKCFLTEQAPDLVANLSEDFFNLDATPFKPTTSTKKVSGATESTESKPMPPELLKDLHMQSQQSTASDQLSSAREQLDIDGLTVEERETIANLEKKRQISQMYQYYNYLIFERNKESFNDINPDLRKMTYKYDAEAKSAFMTVQASPEVIKAAMGMIPAAASQQS